MPDPEQGSARLASRSGFGLLCVGRTELPQEMCERGLVLAREVSDQSGFGFQVRLEGHVDQALPVSGKSDNDPAPITRVVVPTYESPLFEFVESVRHRG